MKKNMIAMLLAGGQGSRLYALTQNVAKPSVPFGGKYRIIDFPLSNCANSGIDTVGVMTQYRPLQLNSYIGIGQPWDLDVNDGGVYILPPYQSAGEKGSWFTGTANAIYQNISFVENYDPEAVVILSGDHIYKMDYADMLREHNEHGAACTISVLTVTLEEATRFGMMNLGEDGYIKEFEEKPKHPKSTLASMGIYIFDWKKLRKYLIEDEANPNSKHDFGHNIIPAMIADEAHRPLRSRVAHQREKPHLPAASGRLPRGDPALHRHRGLRDRRHCGQLRPLSLRQDRRRREHQVQRPDARRRGGARRFC